eukprot:scaffold5568_cov17-Tisochrysis_lutea.AAC.1
MGGPAMREAWRQDLTGLPGWGCHWPLRLEEDLEGHSSLSRSACVDDAGVLVWTAGVLELIEWSRQEACTWSSQHWMCASTEKGQPYAGACGFSDEWILMQAEPQSTKHKQGEDQG